MEVWKDIPGYEGIYQASTHGQIRTAEGKTTSNSRYATRQWKSRVLKGRGDRYSTGRRVSLWKDGEEKEFLVARLVAMTFIGPPPEGYTVNHKDGNRLNNNIENLEWLSTGDNTRHAFETGLCPFQKKTVLRGDGKEYTFRSEAEASRFLGRNNGYVSLCIKRERSARSADGAMYRIEIVS